MSGQPVRGSTEWGRIVHLFVEGELFGPGRTSCGRRTRVVVPPDIDAVRCLDCFPERAATSSTAAGVHG